MKKILDKWYLSIFIIPIILNYLTSYFSLPDIFKNWQYSIIISLVLLVFILLYELKNLKKQLNVFVPKKSDKKIIQKLLRELDLDSFHEDIYEQNSWYGYKKDAISKSISFIYKARLIKNRVTDIKLQVLINNFTDKLNEFHEYSSIHLYGGDNYFIPNKDNLSENRSLVEQETKEMNRLAKESFFELEKLVEYLKNIEYL
ncbi:hypothetical protein RB619_14755 [Flavobacterium sp. LHD-80]|uniref:hypothetical protein n=1 Tax=Flavobacterium sp. LHD-80 TaxID=3071411 RepID=UPI0027E04466|nr:hypothetical protein [Flavobacterium sp. LHD-80]MDQ6471913.1 hypothetical protein [Flavobacterium sp. LHD-80]